MSQTPSTEILSRWSALENASLRPFGTGLINHTFLAEGPQGRFVLQRLHPVFGGVVNEDLDAVTAHLDRRGMTTPRLVRTHDNASFVTDADERPWRLITFVDGRSFDSVTSSDIARSAGALVARFHVTANTLNWEYRHVRAGVHDTARHRNVLALALETHRSHRLYDRVAPVAEQLIGAIDALAPLTGLPLRHTHGDLKISNLLFDAQGEGLCLVDLDTLGRMAWPHEMGDALRSWCNPAGEESTENAIDSSLFAAAVEGYARHARALITADERRLLVAGVETICLELASRFLADALNESYFGWSQARHATRGDHNLARALGQWTLGASVGRQRAALERVVEKAFAA